VRRLRDLCDRYGPCGYDLEIVDIYQQPEVVAARGVLAVPTLIKELPLPVRVLIGDFTDESRVLAALGLTAEKVG
jgi:circadian clock protein KaiB